MNSRVPRRGALLLRLLGVLGVVVGVFAMHGLTAHHDAAMPTGHPATAMQAEPATAMQTEDVAAPHVKHEVALPIALVDAFDRVAIAPAGDQHGMVSACVAMLTGLLLFLALVLALRSLLAWRLVLLLPPVVRVVLSERSPPWLAPSLSKLCVLRT